MSCDGRGQTFLALRMAPKLQVREIREINSNQSTTGRSTEWQLAPATQLWALGCCITPICTVPYPRVAPAYAPLPKSQFPNPGSGIRASPDSVELLPDLDTPLALFLSVDSWACAMQYVSVTSSYAPRPARPLSSDFHFPSGFIAPSLSSTRHVRATSVHSNSACLEYF